MRQKTLTQHRSPAELSKQLIQAAHHLHTRQWMPAHTGNLSARLNDGRFLITADRVNKGFLTANGIVSIDAKGGTLQPNAPTPSTETPLHLALYEFYPHIGAIVHTHSVAATILSRMARETLVLEGYEILAALDGVESHSGRVSLPIFSNYEDYRHLAIWFKRYAVRFPENSGLLIMGHGLYTWGTNVSGALRQAEALEFMLECELRMAQIAPPAED